jgi:ribonuclease T1
VLRLLFVLFALLFAGTGTGRSVAPIDEIAVAQLPVEAREVLSQIQRGGPYRYRKDGSVFGNREGRLPAQAFGYYREFTVPTPGSRDRGARRIVAGKARDYFYTADHYRSFPRIRE